jgi:hypothetical protein
MTAASAKDNARRPVKKAAAAKNLIALSMKDALEFNAC